jgi:hypothetical protein
LEALTPSSPEVRRIMSDFPIQSLILAGLLPEKEATPFLESWYEKRSPPLEARQPPPSNPAAIFGGFAGMLLAKAPPPGFAASILAESGDASGLDTR